MSYLIDTDIVIYSIKGHHAVMRNFLAHAQVPKSISVITYAELFTGALRSGTPFKNLAVVARIRELFPVIPVDNAIAEAFSTLKVGLLKAGTPLDDMDLFIAATALSMNSVLVTNNEKHFRQIKGLKIENWSK